MCFGSGKSWERKNISNLQKYNLRINCTITRNVNIGYYTIYIHTNSDFEPVLFHDFEIDLDLLDLDFGCLPLMNTGEMIFLVGNLPNNPNKSPTSCAVFSRTRRDLGFVFFPPR